MNEAFKEASRFLGTWTLSICGIVLLCPAIGRRLQFDTANPKAYTSSPLVAVEMGPVLIMGLVLLVHFVRSIYLILKRRWPNLGILTINTVLGLGCIVAAMQIDAPTLVYMT